MWSRLLIRPSLLALRCPSVTKGEKLFSNVGQRLHQRSRQIRSTLPSFCKLYTTDLQSNTEAKNDVEKLEEKVERSTSVAEEGQTTSRSRTKRKNDRLSKKQSAKVKPEATQSTENMTKDEQLLQQIKTIKANPQAILRAFNALEHRPIQAYTLAIKAHIDINSLAPALELWHTMEKDPNIKLNTMAYNKLLHIYYELNDYEKMMEVYNHITQNYRPNIETFHRLIMMATSPEVDNIEQVNWIASEMEKYSYGDFFLTYELFKFYAGHDLWEAADKYIAAMKAQKNLPTVLPLLLKVANLLKIVKTNPTATEEINAQWDDFSKSIKPREISYYGRLLNELLTTHVLEYFLKHDDTRAHELIERVTLIMRDSDARATTMRQLVTTALNAYRLDILPDFEQCLVKHKRLGVLADLGFTYAYNGLNDNLRQFVESPISDGLIMSQLHHMLRGVLWHNTASKNQRYYMVPKEGFNTPEQHFKNTETARELIGLLNKKFGFEPTVETKTLLALAYIKARQNERAREVLADVDPEQSTGFNLYKKTMKYLNKSKDRMSGPRPPNNFWREVSTVIESQDCDQLRKIFEDNPVSNFSPSLLQRAILCFEKFRLIDDAMGLCNKIMKDNRDKLDLQLCKNIVRLSYTYKQQELGEQALELFQTGPWQPARLDFRVTNIVLNFYIFSKQLAKAEEFFQYCIKAGSVIRPYTFGRLLSQVLAAGRLKDAWIYFIQQRTCPLGPRSVDNNGYSALTTMLIYNKLTPYAVALFDSMKEDCVLPDRFVYKQFCDMIFGRNQFKSDVQVLDASGQQVPPPDPVLDEGSSDVKQNTTGESIATIHSSQKGLPKLLALMQLPLEGLPEHSDFKLRVAIPSTVRSKPKM